MVEVKRERIIVLGTYRINEGMTEEQIRKLTSINSYPVEFVRKQETNLYEFYYFRIRGEKK